MKELVNNSNINFLSPSSITCLVIIPISLILKIYLVFSKFNTRGFRLYINTLGGITTLILLLISIISTIGLSEIRNLYLWFLNDNQCSDPISQGLMQKFDYYIRKSYITGSIFTCLVLVLFFVIIIEYLVQNCYEDNEGNEGYESSRKATTISKNSSSFNKNSKNKENNIEESDEAASPLNKTKKKLEEEIELSKIENEKEEEIDN